MNKISVENLAVIGKVFKTFPLFDGDSKVNDKVSMGIAVFAPGSRAPPKEEEYASHDGDEFAYFISGSLKCCSGGEVFELKAGDASFIPAGEAHYSWNETDQPCTLIYFLIKKD